MVEKRKPTTQCHEGVPLTARERSASHSSDDEGSSSSAQSLPNMNAAIQLARASRKKIEEEESKREGTGTTPLSPRTLQFQLPGNHDDEKDGGHYRPGPGDRRLSAVVPPSLLPPLPPPPSDSTEETSDGSPTPRTPRTPRSPRGRSLTDTAEVSVPAEPASPARTQGSPRTATPPYDLSKQKEEYQTLIKVSCIYLLFIYFILFIYLFFFAASYQEGSFYWRGIMPMLASSPSRPCQSQSCQILHAPQSSTGTHHIVAERTN